jgi:hypothetical protein
MSLPISRQATRSLLRANKNVANVARCFSQAAIKPSFTSTTNSTTSSRSAINAAISTPAQSRELEIELKVVEGKFSSERGREKACEGRLSSFQKKK